MCTKEYTNNFEMKRHIWRSHESTNCNFCGIEVENRHNLKRHKIDDHKMTRTPICKFYEEGRCVDAEECLYKHESTNNARSNIETQSPDLPSSNRVLICKKGPKCTRESCDIGESGHLNIKQVLCKYQKRCTIYKCPFKHLCERSDFPTNRTNNRNP